MSSRKKRIVASLVVSSIGAIIGGLWVLVSRSFSPLEQGRSLLAILIAGIVPGFLVCFLVSVCYLPFMEQKEFFPWRLLFGMLFGGLAGASSGAITGIAISDVGASFGSLLGGMTGVIVGFVLTLVGSDFFPKIPGSRLILRLSDIHESAKSDNVVATGRDFRYWQEILSCPTCKFADQEACLQGRPWCKAPSSPDIRKHYCQTFQRQDK
jgi:hypothetical protein